MLPRSASPDCGATLLADALTVDKEGFLVPRAAPIPSLAGD
jgi:hypothetical protein